MLEITAERLAKLIKVSSLHKDCKTDIRTHLEVSFILYAAFLHLITKNYSIFEKKEKIVNIIENTKEEDLKSYSMTNKNQLTI